MFEFEDNVKSHMPFICDGENEAKQFCCMLVNNKWKLHHFENGQWIRVNTSLPDDTTECSPSAFYMNGNFSLSFIAGGSEQDRTFYLYEMESLNSTPKKVCIASAGFAYKGRIFYAKGNNSIFTFIKGEKVEIILNNIEHIYRLNYNPSNPNELLLSVQSLEGKISSWILNIKKETLFEVLCDSEIAYKLAIYNGEYFYAQKGNSGFEDRRIVKASDITLNALDFAEHITMPKLNQMPSTGQMVKNFSSSMSRWAKGGFSVAEKQLYESRKNICTSCTFFTGNRCSKCGCFTAKLWLATEKCPISKW